MCWRRRQTALLTGSNQYPPMAGTPELRRAIADHYRAHQGVDLDWEREITVTSGATEALAAALFATISPGDEVVLFQPLYDAYLPLVRRAGGVPRLVRLTPPALAVQRGRSRRRLHAREPASSCSTIRSTPAPRCSAAPAWNCSPAMPNSTTPS